MADHRLILNCCRALRTRDPPPCVTSAVRARSPAPRPSLRSALLPRTGEHVGSERRRPVRRLRPSQSVVSQDRLPRSEAAGRCVCSTFASDRRSKALTLAFISACRLCSPRCRQQRVSLLHRSISDCPVPDNPSPVLLESPFSLSRLPDAIPRLHPSSSRSFVCRSVPTVPTLGFCSSFSSLSFGTWLRLRDRLSA